MTNVEETALRLASRRGVPFAYASGRVVVLVLEVRIDHGRERMFGRFVSRECESASEAKAVAARVIADLAVFGDSHSPQQVLEVSAVYAASAYRMAMRRMGRGKS